MIDPSERLRRAIQLDSLSLVKRILASNAESQTLLRNYDEDGNTSLHLAAQLGHADIAAHLLHLGHESSSISRNHANVTPLMFSAQAGDSASDPTTAGKIATSRLLIKSYNPAAILIKDKDGLDALAYAAKHGSTAVVQMLLSLPREPILLELAGAPYNAGQEAEEEAAAGKAGQSIPSRSPPRRPVSNLHPLLLTKDNLGNTPLHHASAWGHLKVSRLLVDAGLSATVRNTAGWTPIEYSATVAAEVYLRNLMREKLGALAPERRGNSGIGRAAVGGLGATGRQNSGFGSNGTKAMNVTATMSDAEDDREAKIDEAGLGRARTFTG